MKPATAIYTLASIAVLGLMIYTRTPLENTPAPAGNPATPSTTAPTTSAAEPAKATSTDTSSAQDSAAKPETTAVSTDTNATQQASTASPVTTPATVPQATPTPSPENPTADNKPANDAATQDVAATANATDKKADSKPTDKPQDTEQDTDTSTDKTASPPDAAAKPANSDNAAKPDNSADAKPNYEREQRLAEEIRDAIMDGKPVDLNDGQEDFLAIYTEAEQPRGAVIILHGRGFHPDWQDVAQPLRTGLVEKGWSTLSLQMPVLEKEAKYYDYVPLFPNASRRINAGIAFLKEQGVPATVLAAHSCGAHMAMHWVEEHGDKDIAAYVGMGMGATDYKQEMQQPFPLAGMKVPVLDVYGENEYPQVLKMAPERKQLMQQAGNADSKQQILPGSDHYFTDKGTELNAIVANWLNKLPL